MTYFYKNIISAGFLTLIFILAIPHLAGASNNFILTYNGEELILTGNHDRIDFGRIRKGEVCSAVIKIKNESTKVLLIANVRGGCGLSVPSWPRRPLVPGEEATIQLRYDSMRPGVFNRNLTINANTHSSVTILKIAGEIIP